MLDDTPHCKQTSDASCELDSRYRVMFHMNPLPVFIYDPQTLRFTAVNAAAVREYGYTEEEFLTMSVRDLHPSHELERLERLSADLASGSRTLQWRHCRKDGSRLDVVITSHPLQFNGSEVRIAMAENATRRIAGERRLRLLADASALFSSTDIDGMLQRIVDLAASSMCHTAILWRIDQYGVPERGYCSTVDSEVRASFQSAMREIERGTIELPPVYQEVLRNRKPHLASGLAADAVNRYLRTPVPRAYFSAHPIRSAIVLPMFGTVRVIGMLGLYSIDEHQPFEVGDLATAEDLAHRTALALENAELYRQAREQFDDDLTGNFVAAPEGRILDCNKAFARVFGFPEESSPTGGSLLPLFGGADGWNAFVAEVRQHGRLPPVDIALANTMGAPVYVLASGVAICDGTGTLLRVRGHFYDVSAHKRVEEQLNQSQKIEAVGRLAGGIAHDFNNLLLVIGGQSERLLGSVEPESPLRPAAEAIGNAAQRAARLTQQLLAFSRRQVLTPKVLSVNDVVQGVHEMLTRLIGEDVTCSLTLGEGLPTIKADPGHLEQVLMNLAVNARDAMPHGGTLSIATSATMVDADHARQHPGMRAGEHVCISVSDNGCGMPPEIRSRIFEPFFTTKEVGKGTGLGLPMVYGIVKQSGGYISVHSEVNVGTTFRVYLPACAERSATVVERPRRPILSGSETILLVEDEDDVRALIQEILAAHGYNVLAASLGVEALQIARLHDEAIHLLITDVVMPRMSGRQVADGVRRLRPDTPVLFLSGYTDDAIANHGVLDAGVAFLQKPFTQSSLTAKVREVLTTRA